MSNCGEIVPFSVSSVPLFHNFTLCCSQYCVLQNYATQVQNKGRGRAEVTTKILLSSQLSSTLFLSFLAAFRIEEVAGRNRPTFRQFLLPVQHLFACAYSLSYPVHCVMCFYVLKVFRLDMLGRVCIG